MAPKWLNAHLSAVEAVTEFGNISGRRYLREVSKAKKYERDNKIA